MTAQRRQPVAATAHLSPNFNARKTPIDMIVLHYTGMSSFDNTLATLCDPAQEKSAHFLIAKNGDIQCLVDVAHRAWHAGVSNWQGQRDINSRSIGIEIMNNGQQPFTPAQIDAVIVLCHTLMRRHGIPAHHVVGHSDVAPGRKIDPGPLFPWKALAQQGIGLNPKPRLRDYFATAGKRHDPRAVRDMLTRLGYGTDFSPNVAPPLREIVAAFQSRYEPEFYMAFPDQAGIPTRRTLALLNACLRAQHRRQPAPAHLIRRPSQKPSP